MKDIRFISDLFKAPSKNEMLWACIAWNIQLIGISTCLVTWIPLIWIIMCLWLWDVSLEVESVRDEQSNASKHLKNGRSTHGGGGVGSDGDSTVAVWRRVIQSPIDTIFLVLYLLTYTMSPFDRLYNIGVCTVAYWYDVFSQKVAVWPFSWCFKSLAYP